MYSDGKFEITLDQRKLKTPNGTPFAIESEPLALAVLQEWDSQKEFIIRPTMHLVIALSIKRFVIHKILSCQTALCNTAIDNPNHLQKEDIINYLLNCVQTDTVLFHAEDEKGLYELQQTEWEPLIQSFNKRYETDLQKTANISPPKISDGIKMNIGKYLKSYNLPALHGFTYAVDTLKSLILTFACVDRVITTDKAVLLSRLEEEFQLGHWGRVEWAHDLNQQDLQARVAAAIFFIHCNSNGYLMKQKLVV